MLISSVPTLDQIQTALANEALSPITDPDHYARRALHLLTPVTDVSDISIRFAGSHLRWRRLIIPLPHLLTSTGLVPLERLVELVSQESRPTDLFLDLSFDPVHWVKPIRSGARTVLFGSDLLFGLPHIALDPMVPADAIPGVLRHIIANRLSPAGRFATLEMDLLVSGGPSSLIVEPVDATPTAPPNTYPTPEVLSDLGDYLAATLGGELLFFIDLPDDGDANLAHVEYILRVGDQEAFIAAYLDATGAASIGYPGPWDPSNHPAVPGWVTNGLALAEPGLVVTHPDADLRVLLRPFSGPSI